MLSLLRCARGFGITSRIISPVGRKTVVNATARGGVCDGGLLSWVCFQSRVGAVSELRRLTEKSA